MARSLLLPVLAVTLAFTVPALAQTAAAPQVEAGTYAVDPGHTQVEFGVSHMGFSNFRGRFSDASGALQLDPKAPAKSTFDVTVPTISVNTPVAKLNDELKGDQWLDAKAFPQITFKATSVTPTGPNEAKVTGNFTLHGVTKPLTLNAKLHGAGVNPLNKKVTVGFDLTGSLKRSDFGVKTYVPLIGDEVDITISAAFEKQS
ncbi:polyisoprenoid-binding protein YceI [Rhodopseudomonas rhenobacensis]|uniref:Polyisoprenoid-binding protein YceI n=1 Tax=Rhodopseudomonas rhenobacensis TaxID=87461 RepID=A0A7W7Z1U2_9BRAD|nr:YceI family protein [Rhodopseudomonas rhenobacensis]MBB5046448.1 polyisoprenoid-binding protein YceI [Rhodopseudomonas rhenobacensis]